MNEDLLLLSLYERAPELILAVSRDDKTIKTVSINFERVTGLPREEVAGKRIDELSFWNGAVAANLLAVGGKERKDIHVPIRHRSGKETDFSFTVEESEPGGVPCLILTGTECPHYSEIQQVGVVADSVTKERSFPSREARWIRLFDTIHEISRKFITSPLTDAMIVEVLERFGSAVGASRSYIYEFVDGQSSLATVRWAWNSPGAIPLNPGYTIDVSVIVANSRDLSRLFSERKTVTIRPKDAPALGKRMGALDDTAILAIFPIFLGTRLWGVTGFALSDGVSPLTDMEKGGLSIFADVFGAALFRRDMDEQNARTFNVMSRILDSMNALISVSKMDTYEILFINRFGKSLYGDVTGKRCLDVFDGTQTELCPECSNRWLVGADGLPAGGYKWEYRSPETGRWYHCLASAIEWIDGTIVRIETAFDITDRKALEDRLRDTLAARDTFFSIISHDLKNPVAGLKGVTDTLYQDFETLTSDEIREIAGGINAAASKVFGLLEDLLSWSRIQRGAIPFHPRLVFPLALVDNLRRLHQEAADQKGVSIFLEGQIDLAVLADYDMLSAVFRNLLSNALKFTPKGGKIHFAARRDPKNDAAVEISVRDTGVGMMPETIGRLYKIDQIFSNPGTEGEGGTGLGLILCRDFLAKHNVVLHVESTPGRGSTFSFSLPAAVIPPARNEKE